MTSSKPPCFASEDDWKTWLALAYQSNEWSRLRAYPKERAIALEHMVDLLQKQKRVRVLVGLPTGDLDHKIEEHEGSLETARKQTANVTRKLLNYCIDCTKSFRDRSIANGTCARPFTRFVASYSPLTNEATLEGDPLLHIGRYPSGTDPRGQAAGAREGISFPPRETVAF